jgi:apolipoprotein N-acyltransferase
MDSRSGAATAADIALLAFGAALYTIASPPFDYSLAGWFALAPLFLVLRGKPARAAALYGAVFGVMMCSGVAYWLYFAIAKYFSAPFPLDVLLTIAAYLFFVGIYTGFAAGAAAILMRRAHPVVRWTAIPALWVIAEFARSSLMSGFSWGLLGYTQHRNLTFIQIADLGGVYGLSYLLALGGYAAAECVVSIRRSLSGSEMRMPHAGLAAFSGALVLCLGYGAIRVHQYRVARQDGTIRVALVEHDMPAQERWQRIHYVKALNRYMRATRSAVSRQSTDLIVWPEFASGFYLDREPMARAQLARMVGELGADLLLGAPRFEDSGNTTHYYNSAYLLGSGGKVVDTYDKMRLLPFAEYHPLGLSLPDEANSDYPTEFSAGNRATIFPLSKGSFGVMICFEATYPVFARRLTARGARFLVNISNDVWLAGAGGHAAAAQHFAMAVMRAVENKRALARATMDGITGFVDPIGHPYNLSHEADGVTLGTVAVNRELTIYTRYGDWFVLLCAIYSTLCLMAAAAGIDSTQ